MVLDDGGADEGQLDVVAGADLLHGDRGKGVQLHEKGVANRDEQRGEQQEERQADEFGEEGFQAKASLIRRQRT